MIEWVAVADSRVRALLDGRYQEVDRCEWAALDDPDAVVVGRIWGRLPTMIHLACRPRRCSVSRVRPLIRRVVEQMGRQGYPVTVTALDQRLRQSPMLRRLCARSGGTVYAVQPPLEWLAFYPGGA